MKKIIFLLVTIVIVASAAWVEQGCWFEWPAGSNTWVSQYGSATGRCRKFLKNTVTGDSCNRQTWLIPFADSLSLAQWFEYTITGNRVLDLVRKPGTFAGLGPILALKSNANVVMTFTGFANLVHLTIPTEIIPKYYTFTPVSTLTPAEIGPSAWIAAPDLNTTVIPLSVIGGLQQKLWEKIVVSDVAQACEYHDPDGATIIVTLQVMKPWIDPTTGTYVATLP